MLCELFLDNSHSQLCCINRQINLFKHIRKRSNVILMPMCDHKPLHLIRIALKVTDIRDYKIDSEHIIFRERQSAIYYNNTVFIFKGSDIHSDLFKASKRNDLKF